MKCHIFFTNFDDDEINRTGWEGEEGKLCLQLTHPMRKKAIESLDIGIQKQKFEFIGAIDLKAPEYSFGILQNIEESHPLNNRSMSVGDVAICGKQGKIVESAGWSELSPNQITSLMRLVK